MPASEKDVRAIQTKVKPLIGKRAWGVSLGIGSFITFEFGAKVPGKGAREQPHGEWHLWITYCAWRLEKGKRVIAGSEDSRDELKKAVQHLDNLILQSAKVTPPAWETTLSFEKGFSLRLFPIYTKEYESWMLYTPDGHVLVIGPCERWSYKSADAPSAT